MSVYQLPIEPYNDCWFNCITNSLTSILIARHPSYRMFPLLHGHIYTYNHNIKDEYRDHFRREAWNSIIVRPFVQQQVSLIQRFVLEQSTISSLEEVHEKIQSSLLNGSYTQLRLDRYYYPNGADAGTRHMHHPVIIYGFDPVEEQYLILEDLATIAKIEPYILPFANFNSAYEAIKGEDGFRMNTYTWNGELNFESMDLKLIARTNLEKLLEDSIEPTKNIECDMYHGLSTIAMFADNLHEYVTYAENRESLVYILTNMSKESKKQQLQIQLFVDLKLIEPISGKHISEQYAEIQKEWDYFLAKINQIVQRKLIFNKPVDPEIVTSVADKLRNLYRMEKRNRICLL